MNLFKNTSIEDYTHINKALIKALSSALCALCSPLCAPYPMLHAPCPKLPGPSISSLLYLNFAYNHNFSFISFISFIYEGSHS